MWKIIGNESEDSIWYNIDKGLINLRGWWEKMEFRLMNKDTAVLDFLYDEENIGVQGVQTR